MVKLLALTLVLAGCGKASLGGDDLADAPGGGGGSDGGVIDAPDAMPDATGAACASGRKVFLNFEGVTLTDDANSDSLTNKARWLTDTSSTVPAWRAGSGTRAADILAVTNGVKSRLSATPIEVVTTRPSTGPYVMIALGGESTGNGGTVATIYGGAVSYHDCGDATKNDVGWLSDLNGQTADFVANFVVGAIGWGMGLDGASSTADCMCGWANDCSPAAGACTLANNAASSITYAGESACNAGTQNEITAFSTGFCQ